MVPKLILANRNLSEENWKCKESIHNGIFLLSELIRPSAVVWLSRRWTWQSGWGTHPLLTQRHFHSSICAPDSSKWKWLKLTSCPSLPVTKRKRKLAQSEWFQVFFSVFFNIMLKQRCYIVMEIIDEVLAELDSNANDKNSEIWLEFQVYHKTCKLPLVYHISRS